MAGVRVASAHERSPQASSTDARGHVVVGRRYTVGYAALLLLAVALPFETETRPLFWTRDLSVTNLTVLVAAVAIAALVSLGSLAGYASRGAPAARAYFARRRLPTALAAAFLVSSVISIRLNPVSVQGLTWTFEFVAGALLWLVLPLWLANDVSGRVDLLGKAIVAGASLASVVGVVEVAAGATFDAHLAMFKYGPDLMGPFLRLSATFTSANVAAIYLELSLAFSLVGLVSTLNRPAVRWPQLLVWLAVNDLLLVALVLTYSRGAIVGLAAELLAMAIAGRRMWRGTLAGHPREVIVALTSLVVILGIVTLVVSPVEAIRFTTQSDRSWYQASYRSHVPPTMRAGRAETLRVTVVNRSPLTWSASTPHAYGLGYHWLRPSRAVVRFSSPITWLSSDLPPGGSRGVLVRVTPPPAAGRYLLAWDLIWKGTTWFAPRTGQYDTVPVRVVAPAGQTYIPQPDIPRLPNSGTLSRTQLWSLAISMIRHRPAFGLGPQAVRASYAAFASPWMPRKPPPHVHNLELEMLADWGVVGAGLFFSLVVVLWWPLIERLWSGHVESVWELAVIGAAAALVGHQLVDYFLNKQAIVMFFWLLAGLAAAMAPMTRELLRQMPPAESRGD